MAWEQDLQTVQSDAPIWSEADAQLLALTFMRETGFYQFILFGLGAPVLLLSSLGYLLGQVPGIATLLINTLALYILFTVAHDTAHGCYCRRTAFWTKTNKVLSHIVSLMLVVPLPVFRFSHLGHHHTTHDSARDPDYWVAGDKPGALLLRCLTIPVPYYFIAITKGPERVRRLALGWMAFIGVLMLAAHWGGWLGSLLIIWLVPALLSLALAAFVLDWAAHHPHDPDMFGTAPVYLLPQPLHRIVSLLSFNSTYHMIHHLYPRMPWTRVEEAFWRMEPYLRRRGAVIIDLRRRPMRDWRLARRPLI